MERQETVAQLATAQIQSPELTLEEQTSSPGSKDHGTPSAPGAPIEVLRTYTSLGSFTFNEVCDAVSDQFSTYGWTLTQPLDCDSPTTYTSGRARMQCEDFDLLARLYVGEMDGSREQGPRVRVQLFAPYPGNEPAGSGSHDGGAAC
jgi:hypothetical protein